MLLLVNKPKGITSHDVVNKIRKVTGVSKVGHAGTLDPNATGLLIIGIGRESTKKLGEIAKNTKKTYKAEIFFGEERDTDDALGKIRNMKHEIRNSSAPLSILSQPKDKSQFAKTTICKTLRRFVGEQMQAPPIYSAIKIKGKKAYESARKGEKVKLKKRSIAVYSLKMEDYKYPVLKITAEVSSGTYIRALARDIGRSLGCGAYLNNLKRIRIGNYEIKDAVSLDRLNSENWQSFSL